MDVGDPSTPTRSTRGPSVPRSNLLGRDVVTAAAVLRHGRRPGVARRPAPSRPARSQPPTRPALAPSVAAGASAATHGEQVDVLDIGGGHAHPRLLECVPTGDRPQHAPVPVPGQRAAAGRSTAGADVDRPSPERVGHVPADVVLSSGAPPSPTASA